MKQIDLQFPIQTKSGTINSLKLRRATVGDLKSARSQSKGDDFQFGIVLAANLAEVSPDDILSLDASDFKQVEEVIESFLSPSKR